MRIDKIRERIINEIHPRHYVHLLSIYMLELNEEEINKIIKILEK